MSFDPNSPTQFEAPQVLPPYASQTLGRPMQTTATVLGICFLVVAAFGVLLALSMSVLLPVIMAQAQTQNPNAALMAPAIVKIASSIIGFFGGFLPLVAGIGLLMKASWARVFAIVVAIFLLLSIPFGTIFGGLTLFFLLRSGAGEGYAALSRRSLP